MEQNHDEKASPPDIRKELKQLQSLLQGKEDATTAEFIFTYLCGCRAVLSIEDLQSFAKLSHVYMRKVLSQRDVIQYLRLQHPWPVEIAKTHTLFMQYEALAQTIQQRLEHKDYLDFCSQAGGILSSKAYYQPETMTWWTEKISVIASAQFDIALHREWHVYYREVYTRLSSEFTARFTLRSNLIKKGTTATDTGIAVAARTIPLVGEVIGAILTTGNDIAKQRDIAQIDRWIVSLHEIDQLANGLARMLVEVRSDQLLHLQPQDIARFTRLKQRWQAFYEKENFTLPQKLALVDVEWVLTQMLVSSPSEVDHEEARVVKNIATLKQLIQVHLQEVAEEKQLSLAIRARRRLETLVRRLAPQSAVAEDKSIPQVVTEQSVHLTWDSASTLTSAWQYWRLGYLASDREITWQARFERLQIAGSQQLRKNYWLAKCHGDLEKLSRTNPPDFSSMDVLKKDVTAYLALPGITVSECQTLWQRLQPICSSLPDAIQRAQAQHYRLTQTVEKLARTRDEMQTHYQTWWKKLEGWLQELQPLEEKTAKPVDVSTPLPAQFIAKLRESWDKKNTELFDQHYARQRAIWQWHQKQNLSSEAAKSFQTLLTGLSHFHTQLTTLQKENPLNIEYQQQCQARDTAKRLEQQLLKAYKESEALKSLFSSPPDSKEELALASEEKDSHTPQSVLTTSLTPPHSLSVKEESTDTKSSPLERKIASLDFEPVDWVQTTEYDLGPPPCGFSVLQCRIIVTTNTLSSAAYTENVALAILLTDKTKQYHPYWRSYTRLLQWRRQCQFPALFNTLLEDVWVGSPEHIAHTVLIAEPIGSSQTQASAAAALFSAYQESVTAHLQNSSPEKVPYARTYGCYGLQMLFSEPIPTLNLQQPLSSHDILTRPLTAFCLQLGLYAGLSPTTLSSPDTILTALAQAKYLSAAFIADVRAALLWAQAHPTPATSEQTQLSQHHKHTVYPLWQICSREEGVAPVWDFTRGASPEFDPLLELFHKRLSACREWQVLMTKDKHPFGFLADVIVHRQLFSQENQKRYYYEIPPDTRRLYVGALQKALPLAQQSLAAYLQHLPNHSGWRLEREQEQQGWEGALECLWQSNISPIEKEVSDSKTPVVYISRLCSVPHVTGPRWEIEKRTLSPTIAKQLFLPDGQWRKKDSRYGGLHQVFPIFIADTIQFWVKICPEQPALEYLVTELDRRLGIKGTPSIELVKFHHGGQTSAALISSAIDGDSLDNLIRKDPAQLDRLPLAVFVHTLLRVLLTNPEDDKGDDYFLVRTPQGHLLMRIDNERAFFQPTFINQQWGFKTEQLAVKSILYCLEQMQWEWGDDAEVATIIEDFLQLQPVAVVTDILMTADHLHDGWNMLFSKDEVSAHFEREDPGASLPVLCIPQGWAKELITRFTAISTVLRERTHITGMQLLRVTQPKLAQYYRQAHEKISDKSDGVLPTEAKEHRETKETKETKNDQPLRARRHDLVSKRFDHVTDKLYQRNSHGRWQSQMPHSIAIQSNLRTDSPVDCETLEEIRAKRKYSAKQELAQFQHWQKAQLQRLLGDLLAQRPEAMAEFQGLPLRHQSLLYEQLQKKTLNLDQQRFVLTAMAGIPWQKLDLRRFADSLTDELLEPLLQGVGEQLLQLDISSCIRLTDKSLKTLLRYNNQLQVLAARRVNWLQVTITEFTQLHQLDLSNSLVETLMIQAPRLRELQLKHCERLRIIGTKGKLSNQPFKTPSLQKLSLLDCQATHLIIEEREFYNCFVNQLPHCPLLVNLEVQTSKGLVKIPTFLVKMIQQQKRELVINYESMVRPDFSFLEEVFAALHQDKYLTSFTLSVYAGGLFEAGSGGSKSTTAKMEQKLVKALSANTSLTNLTLAGYFHDIEALAGALKINTTLTHLTLNAHGTHGYNGISFKNVSAFAVMLQVNKTLTTLVLAGYWNIKALAGALKINATLTEFCLARCRIDDDDLEALAAALCTNTTLIKLDLDFSGLTEMSVVGKRAWAEIENRLARNRALLHAKRFPQLKESKIALPSFLLSDQAEINISSPTGVTPTASPSRSSSSSPDSAADSKLSEESIEDKHHIDSRITSPSPVTPMEISPSSSSSEFDDDVPARTDLSSPTSEPEPALLATPILSNAVDLNSSGEFKKDKDKDKDVDIQEILDVGAWILGKRLEINSVRRDLCCRNSRISDKGAQALAQGLASSHTLVTFDLTHNQISDIGIQAFAEALKFNTTLRTLNLSENEIGDEGVRALAAMLKVNRSLVHLDLTHNYKISSIGLQALAEALEDNFTLRSLRLSYFALLNSDDVRQTLLKIENDLKRNRARHKLRIGVGIKGFSTQREKTPLTPKKILSSSSSSESDDDVPEQDDDIPTRSDLSSPIRKPEPALLATPTPSAEQELTDKLLGTQAVKTYLNFSRAEMGDRGAQILGKMLETNSVLRDLCLRDNQINDQGAQALAQGLAFNHTLVTLDLTHNQISNAGIQAFMKALKRNTTLRTLNLSENEIGDEGVQAFTAMLKVNRSLVHLDLTHNYKISSVGLQSLAEALKGNFILCSLRLRCFDLPNSDDDSHVKQALEKIEGYLKRNRQRRVKRSLRSKKLTESVKEKKNLPPVFCAQPKETPSDSSLLTKDVLEQKDVQKLTAELLETQVSKTYLNFSRGEIDDSGAQIIGKMLETNSVLRHLCLRDNRISDKGAQTLAQGLVVNSTLVTLDLTHNQISDAGIRALAAALVYNTTLQTLNLSENEIGDEGVLTLAEMLKVNRSLVRLDLTYNDKISSIGLQLLIEALENNFVLLSLQLRCLNLPDSGDDIHVGQALVAIENCLTRNLIGRTLAQIKNSFDHALHVKHEKVFHALGIRYKKVFPVQPKKTPLTLKEMSSKETQLDSSPLSKDIAKVDIGSPTSRRVAPVLLTTPTTPSAKVGRDLRGKFTKDKNAQNPSLPTSSASPTEAFYVRENKTPASAATKAGFFPLPRVMPPISASSSDRAEVKATDIFLDQ